MAGESILFTSIRIGSLDVPNRFCRSATHDYLGNDDGTVTDRQVALYRELAEGEVGLIVTGHAYVQPVGKASARQIAACDDRFLPDLRRLASAVRPSASKIVLQIAHSGRQTKLSLTGGETPVSPSAVYDPASKIMPRELAGEEIRALAGDFVRAAVRAKEAGFDGVQLHAAHGYLLSSFLSPHANRRTDEWGGPIGNRARLLVDVLRGVKEACGRDFPVLAKLNSSDLFPDGSGLTVDDAVEAARLLAEAGIDAIEVSGGMAEAGRGSMWPGVRAEADEGYFVDAAARVKGAAGVPVIGLGGFRTLAAMERAVASGRVDMVSLSRPFIRDPALVRKLRLGESEMADCISCNRCLNPRGIRCFER